MDQIEYYNDELEGGKKKIKATLAKISRLRGNEKLQAINNVQSLLKTANKNYRRFEESCAKNPLSSREKYEKIKTKHRNELRKLEKSFMMCKNEAGRDSLLGLDTTGTGKKKERNKKDHESTVETISRDGKKKIKDEALEKELFKDVYAMYDESLEIVSRLINKVDETEKIAADSMEVLAKQKEQLKCIDGEMDEMGSGLKIARKELSSFMRRVMRTKIILIAVAIIFVLILLCVIAGAVYLILVSVGILSPPTIKLPGTTTDVVGLSPELNFDQATKCIHMRQSLDPGDGLRKLPMKLEIEQVKRCSTRIQPRPCRQ